MTNKNILAAISISTLILTSPMMVSNSSVVLDTINNSLTNSLFAEAQYGGPIANDDMATTDVDTAVVIDVLDNDDLDGGAGPFSLDSGDCGLIIFRILGITAHADVLSGPSNGSVALTGSFPNHTYTYTPNPGFTGTDTFTYENCDVDSAQLSNEATVTVTVQNNTPVAVDDNVTTPYETPVNIDVLDNDELGGTTGPLSLDSSECGAPLISFSPLSFLNISAHADIVTSPANGTVVLTGTSPNQTYTYTPNTGFSGTDSFTYTNCDTDGGNDSNVATVNITVEEEIITEDPIIEIFKDKADGTVQVGDDVKIQIDVTNPNTFDLVNLETQTTVDPQKVKIIDGTVEESVIAGTKFVNLFSINASAQATFSSSVIGNQVFISFPLLQAGETRSFVFDINSLETGVGNFDTQVSVNGTVTSQDTTIIPVSGPVPIGGLVRTGGENSIKSLPSLIAAIAALGTSFLVFTKVIKKKSKSKKS